MCITFESLSEPFVSRPLRYLRREETVVCTVGFFASNPNFTTNDDNTLTAAEEFFYDVENMSDNESQTASTSAAVQSTSAGTSTSATVPQTPAAIRAAKNKIKRRRRKQNWRNRKTQERLDEEPSDDDFFSADDLSSELQPEVDDTLTSGYQHASVAATYFSAPFPRKVEELVRGYYHRLCANGLVALHAVGSLFKSSRSKKNATQNARAFSKSKVTANARTQSARAFSKSKVTRIVPTAPATQGTQNSNLAPAHSRLGPIIVSVVFVVSYVGTAWLTARLITTGINHFVLAPSLGLTTGGQQPVTTGSLFDVYSTTDGTMEYTSVSLDRFYSDGTDENYECVSSYFSCSNGSGAKNKSLMPMGFSSDNYIFKIDISQVLQKVSRAMNNMYQWVISITPRIPDAAKLAHYLPSALESVAKSPEHVTAGINLGSSSGANIVSPAQAPTATGFPRSTSTSSPPASTSTVIHNRDHSPFLCTSRIWSSLSRAIGNLYQVIASAGASAAFDGTLSPTPTITSATRTTATAPGVSYKMVASPAQAPTASGFTRSTSTSSPPASTYTVIHNRDHNPFLCTSRLWSSLSRAIGDLYQVIASAGASAFGGTLSPTPTISAATRTTATASGFPRSTVAPPVSAFHSIEIPDCDRSSDLCKSYFWPRFSHAISDQCQGIVSAVASCFESVLTSTMDAYTVVKPPLRTATISVAYRLVLAALKVTSILTEAANLVLLVAMKLFFRHPRRNIRYPVLPIVLLILLKGVSLLLSSCQALIIPFL